MRLDHFSIVLCRGIGLTLVIFGFSCLLPLFLYGPYPTTIQAIEQSRPGWTSYAPMMQTARQLPLKTVLAIALRANLPAIAQVLSGGILLVFSRAIGMLLTGKLLDRAT